MKLVPVFHGAVDKDGKLHLEARDLFDRYLATTFKNKPVRIVVKPATRPKSKQQLGYLFGIVYPVLAEHFGYCDYELDALHDACMRELRGLKPEPNPLKLRESLSDHDHQYTSDYISDLRHWALTKYGCVTPDAEKAEAA